MIPELVGRLPVITPLMPLDDRRDGAILTEPKNALVKQYQHLFALEGAELSSPTAPTTRAGANATSSTPTR
jgi:ATP-dependent Clp protease ATP-binding subunit ClpX